MRAKGHKEPVGTRGQASRPAPPWDQLPAWPSGFSQGTSHTGSAPVGQSLQTPGCPGHPWVGPGSLALSL